MSYKHLSLEERHYIELEHKKGVSQNAIAKALGRHQSNISREINRNTGLRGYRHKQANSLCKDRHQNKAKHVKLTAEIKLVINDYLEEDWSPEQIAGRLKKDAIVTLHHETIYQQVSWQINGQEESFTNIFVTRKRPTVNATAQPIIEQEYPIELILMSGRKRLIIGSA